MAKRKKNRRSHQKPTKPVPTGLAERLRRVDQLMFSKQLAAARDLLEELDRRYPRQPEILHRLTNVYHDLKDYAALQAACERLVAVKPSAGFTLMLAGSYLLNTMPILALRTFLHFLDRWPDHPRAGEARETVASLQAGLDELLAGLQLTGPDALELATLHEQVQSLLAQGKYPEARQKAEELLGHRPNFPAALNNISQTYFVEGLLEQAIATARRAPSKPTPRMFMPCPTSPVTFTSAAGRMKPGITRLSSGQLRRKVSMFGPKRRRRSAAWVTTRPCSASGKSSKRLLARKGSRLLPFSSTSSGSRPSAWVARIRRDAAGKKRCDASPVSSWPAPTWMTCANPWASGTRLGPSRSIPG